jgi:hypothetical protein
MMRRWHGHDYDDGGRPTLPQRNGCHFKISAFITITFGVLALAMPPMARVAATYFEYYRRRHLFNGYPQRARTQFIALPTRRSGAGVAITLGG